MDWKKKSAAVLVAGGMFGANEAPAQPIGTNLIQNASFETVDASQNLNANWLGPNLGTYTYSMNYTGPAPAGAGARYWRGVNRPTTAPPVLMPNANQTLNLIAAGFTVPLLDSGTLQYNFRSFFSGYGAIGTPDYADARATFLDAANVLLGTRTIGGLAFTNALPTSTGPFGGTRRDWGEDVATGLLPVGTRSILIDLNGFLNAGGAADGYVDLININLTPVPEPATFVLVGGTGLIGFIVRVRRLRQSTPRPSV